MNDGMEEYFGSSAQRSLFQMTILVMNLLLQMHNKGFINANSTKVRCKTN